MKLLAQVLGNFAAISLGVGIYEDDISGTILGIYSLILALNIIRRV